MTEVQEVLYQKQQGRSERQIARSLSNRLLKQRHSLASAETLMSLS